MSVLWLSAKLLDAEQLLPFKPRGIHRFEPAELFSGTIARLGGGIHQASS